MFKLALNTAQRLIANLSTETIENSKDDLSCIRKKLKNNNVEISAKLSISVFGGSNTVDKKFEEHKTTLISKLTKQFPYSTINYLESTEEYASRDKNFNAAVDLNEKMFPQNRMNEVKLNSNIICISHAFKGLEIKTLYDIAKEGNLGSLLSKSEEDGIRRIILDKEYKRKYNPVLTSPRKSLQEFYRLEEKGVLIFYKMSGNVISYSV